FRPGADAVDCLALAPDPGADAPLARPRPAFASRMPLIAGIAVLALSALAIVAALMPAPAPEVDVEHRLRALAQEFEVGDVVISRDVEVASCCRAPSTTTTRARVSSRASRPREWTLASPCAAARTWRSTWPR